MPDYRIKKSRFGDLKVVAVIVLAGVGLFAATALCVGYVVSQMRSSRARAEAEAQSSVPMGTPWPPNQPLGPFPGVVAPQGARPDGSLPQTLPLPEGLPFKALPPLPSHKPIAFTAVRSLGGKVGPVFALALSSNGQQALAGGSDNIVRLWDVASGQELARLEGHRDAIRGVAFSSDGKRAASASLDGTLRLWDVEKKTSTRVLKGHRGAVLCTAFVPDGKALLSGGSDRSLRVWDVETGKQLHEWYGHEAEALCVTASPDGTSALTGSADGGVMHWDLRSGRELAFISLNQPVRVALFSSDGKRAILGGNAPARLCDLASGEQWPAAFMAGQPVQGAVLIPGDNVFLQVTGTRLEGRFLPAQHVPPGSLKDPQWNLVGMAEAHDGAVTSVCASRDGRLALTAGEDGAIKVWQVRERESGNPQ